MLKAAAQGGRLAGNALKWLLQTQGPTGPRMMNAGELALRLVPDVGFAALSAAQTPGDLTDKLTVAGTQILGGTGAGLAAGRLVKNPVASSIVDTMASVAGDYASMPIADALMRGKDKLAGGKGQTPFERLNEQQQMQLAAAIEQNVLSAMI